jgi:hypothetical protein
MGLGRDFHFFRADHKEVLHSRGIPRAGCGHHGGVCLVRVGVRGNDH